MFFAFFCCSNGACEPRPKPVSCHFPCASEWTNFRCMKTCASARHFVNRSHFEVNRVNWTLNVRHLRKLSCMQWKLVHSLALEKPCRKHFGPVVFSHSFSSLYIFKLRFRSSVMRSCIHVYKIMCLYYYEMRCMCVTLHLCAWSMCNCGSIYMSCGARSTSVCACAT